MAKVYDYNGKYCESEYEYAVLAFLEKEGWLYAFGNNIGRKTKRDVLIENDFKSFVNDINPGLKEDDINQLFNNIKLAGATTDFATLHKVYGWIVNGYQFTPQNGEPRMVKFIDFDSSAYITIDI